MRPSLSTSHNSSIHSLLEQNQTLLRLASIPLAAVGMLALEWGIGNDNVWAAASLAAFTTAMMFCWTSVLHEAAHHTLWANQALCIWTGRILGTLMFTPYTVYREVHIRHHAYLNTPQDWELWPYSDPQSSLAFRRAYVWFDLLLGVLSGPFIYGRIYFHRNSPITSPGLRREIRYEYLAIFVFWGLVWTGVTLLGMWPIHLRGILLPMYLAAFLQTGRKFTEHLGMKSIDPLLGTRTVVPSATLMKVCSYFNFDIFVHGPHHRHPRLTHGTLEPKMHEYCSEHPEIVYPVYYHYWKAVRDMLPSMLINPACGTLAEIPMGQPSSADLVTEDMSLPQVQVQVQEFVEDVVEEVIEANPESQKSS
jgi:fatty acid desaturase